MHRRDKKMDDDNQYQRLDEKLLIFRQIDRINKLSTFNLEDNSFAAWHLFINRLHLSVNQLQSLLYPLLDDDYTKEITNLKKRFEAMEQKAEQAKKEEKLEIRTEALRKFSVEKYNQLISLLFRNGQYFGQSLDVVIDEDKGVDVD